MVVQVIAEELDTVDSRKSLGWICKVTREEDESDIAPIFAVLESREVSDFERRLAVRVHDLRSILKTVQPSSIHEFLQEHSSIYSVCLLLKYRREYDSHSIVAGLDEDGFFFAVLHNLQISLDLGWLQVCLLGTGRLLVRCLKRRLFCKSGKKRRGHCGGLEMGNFGDKGGSLLRALRQSFQINQQTDIVLRLCISLSEEIALVLVLEMFTGTILDKVRPALDTHGEKKLSLG